MQQHPIYANNVIMGRPYKTPLEPPKQRKGPPERFGFKRRLAWARYIYNLGEDGFGWSEERERQEYRCFLMRYYLNVEVYPTVKKVA